MVAQITKLTIFNRALQLLGVGTKLSSEHQDTDNGAALRTAYDSVLRSSLEEHQWDFVTKNVTLSLISSASNLTKFGYLFARPSDCLRIWSVYTTDPQDPIEYKSTSEGIYTNKEVTNVEYTYFTDDVSLFPSLFIDHLVARLAEEVSMEILNSDSRTSALQNKASFAQAKSASSANVQVPPEYKFNSGWLSSRGLNG